MLLMVEKGIRRGICHSIYRYTKANNKYMKDYDKNRVGVQYLEKLHEIHNDLPFLPERMKTEKVEKLVANLHDKTEYVIHIKNLKQALNHGLVLKNIHSRPSQTVCTVTTCT